MISKKYRFTRRNFLWLKQQMKSFYYKGFLFLYGKDKYHAHYAVVVSRKIEKRAVKRNAFRRQVYHAFREMLLPTYPKINVICLYKGKKIPENKAAIYGAVHALAKALSS